jgi:glycerate dehydrogenase
MKIVLLDAATLGDVNLSPIEEFGNLKVYPETSPEQVVDRSSGADAIITNKVKITKEVIDNLPELRLVCIAATGMNNVDLVYAEAKGVKVKNASSYSTHSVAQATFALLLGLMHSTSYFDGYVKDGRYARSSIFTHYGGRSFSELSGKQYGIVGLGNIGRQVAHIAEAFGAEVAYYSTSGKHDDEKYKRVSMDELLQTSDVISIHAPLNDDTYNLIGTEQLKKMKSTAYLINMGRGGIVNEYDLAQALDNNVIAGAGLDVFKSEPMSTDNPLLKVKNLEKLMLSPHTAWASEEARETLVRRIALNIKNFLE